MVVAAKDVAGSSPARPPVSTMKSPHTQTSSGAWREVSVYSGPISGNPGAVREAPCHWRALTHSCAAAAGRVTPRVVMGKGSAFMEPATTTKNCMAARDQRYAWAAAAATTTVCALALSQELPPTLVTALNPPFMSSPPQGRECEHGINLHACAAGHKYATRSKLGWSGGRGRGGRRASGLAALRAPVAWPRQCQGRPRAARAPRAAGHLVLVLQRDARGWRWGGRGLA